jgi:hypothetical protein
MFDTPILFLIFNRLEITQLVFEEIKKQKPKYLFIAADGARTDNLEDVQKCKMVRDLVLKGIDWDCEVTTLFRDQNLGCGVAVSEAITWFFENVEQGIILEDDCLPHASFFGFCEILLEKYKDDENVYGISGDNFQDGIQRGNASYFFSNYCYIWGWASWRRAWNSYDFNLNQLEVFKEKQLIKKIDSRTVFKNYWFAILEKVANKEIDTWDYQWLFTVWNNGGVAVVPNVNLISNIGFGKDATHTTELRQSANMTTKDIYTITHPKAIKVDKIADRYASDTIFNIHKTKKLNFKDLKRFLKRIFIKLSRLQFVKVIFTSRRKVPF